MLTRTDIENKLEEIKPWLFEEFNVKKIGLFGSYADGTNTAESDIDLVVELEKPIGWKFFTLEIYLEKLFNKNIDLVSKNAIKEQLKDTISKQVRYV